MPRRKAVSFIPPIQPTGDRVLFRRLEMPRRDGLVVIEDHPECLNVDDHYADGTHDDYRRRGVLGEVIAVGPGRLNNRLELVPCTVKPGEILIFTNWDDLDGMFPGYALVREGDIWGYPSDLPGHATA